jgi:hypothetical protein
VAVGCDKTVVVVASKDWVTVEIDGACVVITVTVLPLSVMVVVAKDGEAVTIMMLTAEELTNTTPPAERFLVFKYISDKTSIR